jgi:methylaspartate ammonia-lyase
VGACDGQLKPAASAMPDESCDIRRSNDAIKKAQNAHGVQIGTPEIGGSFNEK